MVKEYVTYKITNRVTGKFYYGSSCEVKKRFARHARDLKHKKHHSVYLQRSFDKHGKDNFTFEVDDTFFSEEAARAAELKVIADPEMKSKLYNVSTCAGGGDLVTGHPREAEIRAKCTEALRRVHETTTHEMWSQMTSGSKNGMFGQKHSEFSKRQMSQTRRDADERRKLSGIAHRSTGRKITAHAREILSNKAKLRTGSKNSFYGRKHSKETLDKLRNRPVPQNARKCCIGGVEYQSLAAASTAQGIHPATLAYRLKTGKPGYVYLDDIHPIKCG